MTASEHTSGQAERARSLNQVALIWLVGFNLRSVILAVPPALPFVRADLHLSFAMAGALASVPILALGVAAIPGALFVNRSGARTVIAVGVLGVGFGAVMRLGDPVLLALFAGTLLLSLSAAISQPATADYIREWFPHAVQRVSAVYTIGISVGSLAGTVFTGYLLAIGGWRGTFVIWAIPAFFTGLLWLAVAPRPTPRLREPLGLGTLICQAHVWRAAGLFGAQSLVYLTATTWIPFLFAKEGSHYVSTVLLVMGAAGIPSGILLSRIRWPFATSKAFYVVAGLLMFAGTLGFSIGMKSVGFMLAALVGIGSGLSFTATMALPPMAASRHGLVASYAGLMFSGGYALSFAGPFSGGFLVDRIGQPSAAFWPAAFASVLFIGLGVTVTGSRPSVGG